MRRTPATTHSGLPAALLTLVLLGCNEPQTGPVLPTATLLEHDGWSRDFHVEVPALADDALVDLIIDEVRALNTGLDSTSACIWWRAPLQGEGVRNCVWPTLRITVDGVPQPTYFTDSLAIVTHFASSAASRHSVDMVLRGQQIHLGTIGLVGLVETMPLDSTIASPVTPWRNGTALAYDGGGLAMLELATGRATRFTAIARSGVTGSMRQPGVSSSASRFLVDRVSDVSRVQVWQTFPAARLVQSLPCYHSEAFAVVQIADTLCVIMAETRVYALEVVATGPQLLWIAPLFVSEGQEGHWVVSSRGHAVMLNRTWGPTAFGFPVVGGDGRIQWVFPGFLQAGGAAFSRNADTLFVAAQLPSQFGALDSILGTRVPYQLRTYNLHSGTLLDSILPVGEVFDMVRSPVNGRLLTAGYTTRGDSIEMVISAYDTSPLSKVGSFAVPVDDYFKGRLVLDEVRQRLYWVADDAPRSVMVFELVPGSRGGPCTPTASALMASRSNVPCSTQP